MRVDLRFPVHECLISAIEDAQTTHAEGIEPIQPTMNLSMCQVHRGRSLRETITRDGNSSLPFVILSVKFLRRDLALRIIEKVNYSK